MHLVGIVKEKCYVWCFFIKIGNNLMVCQLFTLSFKLISSHKNDDIHDKGEISYICDLFFFIRQWEKKNMCIFWHIAKQFLPPISG